MTDKKEITGKFVKRNKEIKILTAYNIVNVKEVTRNIPMRIKRFCTIVLRGVDSTTRTKGSIYTDDLNINKTPITSR